MNIAIVSSECAPFAKTGGLADVVGALPKYLEELGVNVKVFIPKYDSIDEAKFGLWYHGEIGEMKVRVGGFPRSVYIHSAKILRSTVDIYFIDCKEYFHRGKIYTEQWDEDERFILFQKAVIETMQRLQWAPDVIHCNDWQTGLLPILVKDNYSWDSMFSNTAFLMSIHNIGYQGRFSSDTMKKAELRPELFDIHGPLEYENGINFLKGGIHFSEIISTVSETYSKEILTDAYGSGMQTILRSRKDDLFGVLNGIDIHEWDPETDKFIPHHYSANNLSGKLLNKKFLLEKTSLPFDENKPVIGIVSRLVAQKGFDLIEDAIYDLMNLDVQWIILGNGEARYEKLFQLVNKVLPRKFWCYIGFNNELAHLIEAGADMFVMPSHYEPCGLNQMYSLRYGTVPIVRKTGGLADTVHDWHDMQYRGSDSGNGFSFYDASGDALFASVKRAIDSFHINDEWRKIQLNGMNTDFSWEHSAKQYVELYKMATNRRK